jgi:NAD(P)-dependent dehydrogenase (short-subunit alcohol dehydrogenase family)
MSAATSATAEWTTARMPDLAGKTVVITGANSGIGLEAARAFAAHGAHVVFAVRTESKGQAAAATIPGSTEVRQVDLADLASVRRFAADWSGNIHALINNAGILVPPFGLTRDGFELQFGINHLGHFALTNLLLPHITGRVVTVASSEHRTASIDFDDLNWTAGRYHRGQAYGQSKLANLLFILELQRRLTASGSPVLAMAAHPGWASTNLGSTSYGRVMNAGIRAVNRVFAQDAAAGATPTLFAATEPIAGGSYAGPSGRRGMAGPPTLVGRSSAASDPAAAARLWTASEELTGVSFPLLPNLTTNATKCNRP